MPPDVGKYTLVCQNIGPAVAGSAGPVPPPLTHAGGQTQQTTLQHEIPSIVPLLDFFCCPVADLWPHVKSSNITAIHYKTFSDVITAEIMNLS